MWKVTQEAARHGIVFLGKKPKIVSQAEKPREESAGIFHAAAQYISVGEPEAARQKRAFAPAKTVVGLLG